MPGVSGLSGLSVLPFGGAGISYLLRDEFTDPLAAGSINGTPAVPGPGTRTVSDPGNELPIVAGWLGPNTGHAGDPILGYTLALARIAGRLAVGLFNPVSAGVRVNVGFANTSGITAPTFQGNGVSCFGNFFTIYDESAAPTQIDAHAANTEYQWAVVQRAAGAYYFLMGGAFSEWNLVWIGSSCVRDPMYAVALRCDFLTSKADYLRVPDVLWLPTPVAYDTFTRANGALGSSEAVGPDAQTVAARAWNNRVGTTQIATNKASASALVGGIAIATVDTGTADVVMEGTCTRAGNEVGVICRYVDADNYVRAVHDGTNCQLIKRVATVETTVITAAVAIGAGKISVVASGTQFTLFLNNAKVGAISTIADAALQSGTEQGLFSTNVGNTQDGFLVMPRGTGGEYATLDEY